MLGELYLPVTFDSWYTQPYFCHYLYQTLHMSYVGTFKDSAKIVLKTGEEEVKSFAYLLKQEHLTAFKTSCPLIFKPITIPTSAPMSIFSATVPPISSIRFSNSAY